MLLEAYLFTSINDYEFPIRVFSICYPILVNQERGMKQSPTWTSNHGELHDAIEQYVID
jgi:hypothetical protein